MLRLRVPRLLEGEMFSVLRGGGGKKKSCVEEEKEGGQLLPVLGGISE